MAMNNPYVDENLRTIANMQMQALQNVTQGGLLPQGMIPTQELVRTIIGLAPNVYSLYGPNLGEDWLKQYLPAAGSTITYPMRQALLAYERAMAPERGLSQTPLAAQYNLPGGTPTLPMRATEAGHQQWRLAQEGKWYNPATGHVETMPSVLAELAGYGVDLFGTAGAAPSIGGAAAPRGAAPTMGSFDYGTTIRGLSAENPYRRTLESITAAGSTPTLSMIQSALEWQAKQKPEQATPAKPDEAYNHLAALAAEYDNTEDYRSHLRTHASEIVAKIGPDKYQALLDNADMLVRGTEAPAQNAPWPLSFFARKTPAPRKGPGLDLVGEFIKEAKASKVW